jgi:hypothetical protein
MPGNHDGHSRNRTPKNPCETGFLAGFSGTVRVVNTVNERKVCVGARVDPEIRRAVRHLADAGNRSFSREVEAALRRHVLLEQFSSEPAGAVDPRAAIRPPHSGHGEHGR